VPFLLLSLQQLGRTKEGSLYLDLAARFLTFSHLTRHSDVSITLRTYDHVESDAFRAPLNEAANQLL
jgi:hypothetical protein